MSTEKIIIAKENAGLRLDKFLKKEFLSYSRGEIIRSINSGYVLVNDKEIKPSYPLKENDILTINFQEVLDKLIPNANITFEIVYQDKNFIVINKPAGLSIHPVAFTDTETLANGLLASFPEIENVHDESLGAKMRPGIVHRLDKDTSGLIIIARNQKSFDKFKDLFKTRKINKKYLAVVQGKLSPKEGVIEKPIAKSTSYKKQVIAGRKTKTKIRPAITEYTVLKEFSDFSLVEARPKTGRTHQIRIHLFSLGHPIVGDKLYKSKEPFKITLPKRQLLHAAELEFKFLGKKYSFTTKPPADLADFLKNPPLDI